MKKLTLTENLDQTGRVMKSLEKAFEKHREDICFKQTIIGEN